MKRAVDETTNAGATSLAPESHKDSEGAIRLYQSLGFIIELEPSFSYDVGR